jgi:hypothetical protein
MSERAVLALLEAATAGSRGLDAQIWLAFIERPRPGDKLDRDIIGKWPAYTTSLDAALTLVPDQLTPTIGQNVHHRTWVASVNELSADGEPRSVAWGQHFSSGPIALCIAALTARQPHPAVSESEG